MPSSFPDALSKLFGGAEGAARGTQQGTAARAPDNGGGAEANRGGEGAQPAQPATTQELIDRAAADLSDYQRLTAEGKLGEAGQKLESLKRTLEELQKSKR